MVFTEDLSAFFVDFGDDAVLSGQPVRGLLDHPVRHHGLGPTGAGIVAQDTSYLMPQAAVPASVFGATLVVLGISYTVREALPDGNGLARLTLSKA